MRALVHEVLACVVMRPSFHFAGALALLPLVTTGCTKRRFAPTVHARIVDRKIADNREQKEDVLDVRADVDNGWEARVTNLDVIGKKAPGGYQYAILPADSVPVGTSVLRVRVSGEVKSFGKRWKPVEQTLETTVTRPALPPRAHIVPYYGGGSALASERISFDCPAPMRSEPLTTFVASAPKGTKIEILGKSVTANGFTASTVSVHVPLVPLVLGAKLDDRVRVDARVTSPDGITETAWCSISPGSLVTWATLSRVRSAPVLFAGEDATQGKPKVAAVLARQMVSTLGKGTLRELELVADVDPLPVRRRECGVYTGQSTGKRIAISNVAEDADVTIYARKTGKVVAKRRFSAPMPACPSSISAKFTGFSGEVDAKSIDAFVTSFLAK